MITRIKNRIQSLRSSMTVNIIGAIVLLLVLLGIIVSTLGFLSFTRAFKNEYAVTTYHMADTASTLVNGDHIDEYLAGEEQEEYRRSLGYLDGYCQRMNVSLVYVIQVDRSDYGRFVSVFNCVNNRVGGTSYTPWELGHAQNTTNEEYRRKYQAIYEEDAAYETVYRLHVPAGQKPHITTLVPVRDSSGQVSSVLCIQRPASEFNEASLPYLKSVAVSTILLALTASFLASAYFRRQLMAPIRRVSDEATRFARENIKGEELGRISKFEELASLARSIDTMETDMVSYIENLTAATAEKERIGAELSLASKIQENSIPNDFPAFPDRTDFDIYGVMDPAREVGGDFYNFFFIDDDHLALVIGDVSGKGIPGALFMMVTNILLSDRTQLGGSPKEVLEFVNEQICLHNDAEMFVTVWMGILELSTGTLTAANAGHEYPMLRRAGGEFELLKDKHGFVIGGMEGVRFTEYELRLSPGDKLFVYTDGVPEATDENNGMFGLERTLSALNEAPDGSPQELLNRVRKAVDSFVGDAEPFDDLTMLCVEYRGKSPEKAREEA